MAFPCASTFFKLIFYCSLWNWLVDMNKHDAQRSSSLGLLRYVYFKIVCTDIPEIKESCLIIKPYELFN